MVKQSWADAWHKLAYGTGASSLRWISPLLWPASLIYGTLAKTRRVLYEMGRKKKDRLPVPVISVGNLTVGGVGKTPCGLAIANMLLSHGYRPAVLLRGYKRQSIEPMVLLPENFDPMCVTEYGDEAALYSLNARVPVGIGSNRFEVGTQLLRQTSCDVILLDDGFQHYPLHRDIDLVLLDGDNPIGNGHCLPYGPLREPTSVLHAASAIICRGETSTGMPSFPIPQFHGLLHWTGIKPLLSWSRGEAREAIAIERFTPRSVVLLSGIGNPARLLRQAENLGFAVERHFSFPDHHWFTTDDLRHLIKSTQSPILITEKDAVRILPLLNSSTLPWDRLHVVSAEWRFAHSELFESWLMARLPQPGSVR